MVNKLRGKAWEHWKQRVAKRQVTVGYCVCGLLGHAAVYSPVGRNPDLDLPVFTSRSHGIIFCPQGHL